MSPALKELERQFGVRSGSINPNLFQDQEYKFGSLCNPSARDSRAGAGRTCWIRSRLPRRSVRATFRCGWRTGRTIRERRAFASGLGGLKRRCATAHEHLAPDQRLLVEYKPFEPAFYHTDIADWGMSTHFARHGGPAGARAGGYRAPLLVRRILSRLWRGCCIRACWADSTSTTGAMRTTI